MMNREEFVDQILSTYTFKGDALPLGGAVYDGEVQTGTFVQVPLKTLNRHGLIAGATGTGKTKTLQILAEQLANRGISSLLMDIKGDLSGIAVPSEGHPKIDERHNEIGLAFEADGSTVEFLSLSDEPGVRLRATVTEFGPVLFSKILDLSEVQMGVVAVVFKYCDDNNLPLLDLNDFKKALTYISNEGKKEVEKEYGRISSASVGAIIRKLISLEQQGADRFFGEVSFDVDDLVRVDDQGRGTVSILRLTDIQGKPALFSTFMMSLLAEIYATFPELGDSDQPELVIFIDEAHLMFDNASDELLDQIETIIKLIRSKGVGIFFCTQNPVDIPEDVLGQLGLKIQHALRAFTAKDRKAIKLAVQNFPETEAYDVEELITSLGIGEAFVTVLNEKGIPTPLVHTMLRAPQSRMDILTDGKIGPKYL
ncbi:MAG: helicase HerA-like domain-containing protein [Bacteroidota bacterium]